MRDMLNDAVGPAMLGMLTGIGIVLLFGLILGVVIWIG